MNSELLDVASRHVAALFEARLPEGCRYHTFEHTAEVTAACLEIGGALGLGSAELEILQLAGWFHDTGYVELRDGHEAVSARIAREFLASHGLPDATVAQVERCIMATHYPQQPRSLMEEVICDADLIYLGRDRYAEQSSALRSEWESTQGLVYTDAEWLDSNIEFLTGGRYHTPYARSRYDAARAGNLRMLEEKRKSRS
jgi:predicted metal-dependent HD superfamily phosphohydrolase